MTAYLSGNSRLFISLNYEMKVGKLPNNGSIHFESFFKHRRRPERVHFRLRIEEGSGETFRQGLQVRPPLRVRFLRQFANQKHRQRHIFHSSNYRIGFEKLKQLHTVAPDFTPKSATKSEQHNTVKFIKSLGKGLTISGLGLAL